ncbi:haloacid dehalogenase type II [Aquibacillus salsiterrae]|uniref:Haloacid dehalogenase type II n=1 Tax=Aquibacillus salsiterrae TaxID=2950439 RepID=A0A9X3WFD6_9BACI|nr:haloacid dehalogenase type II [Aquibacillus salsiterrae]MDC3417988.1 haloacid dehalogenase type II [Aquibacillus salsiterrae]
MIQTIIFDSYGTLFDVNVLSNKLNNYFPGDGEAINKTWRDKQLDYAFIREITGTYCPFSKVVRDSLHYAVNKHGYELQPYQEIELLQAYLTLPVYPEVKSVLTQLNQKSCAILSNGSHDMLDPLIINTGLYPFFTRIISTDEIRHYKPNPLCYHYASLALASPKTETLYVSANEFGIAGANSYGFYTAWINRDKNPLDRLDSLPTAVYQDLNGILEWS